MSFTLQLQCNVDIIHDSQIQDFSLFLEYVEHKKNTAPSFLDILAAMFFSFQE